MTLLQSFFENLKHVKLLPTPTPFVDKPWKVKKTIKEYEGNTRQPLLARKRDKVGETNLQSWVGKHNNLIVSK